MLTADNARSGDNNRLFAAAREDTRTAHASAESGHGVRYAAAAALVDELVQWA